MKPTSKIAWALVICLLSVIPAITQALQSDQNQPTYIEADSVEMDDGTGISIYKGNVVVTQGSIRFTADKVVVTQKPGEADHLDATGRPVHFQQEVDNNEGLVKGRSKRVEYSSDSEIIYLIDDAFLTQKQDTFSSDRIIYDRAKAVVKAGTSAKGKERVRVTIGGTKKQ
ncbi:MAG: lipopolysaccharide transport periplasmic protein LptA [Sedimenticola sp.]